MNVRFERREKLAPDIWQYYFTPERPLDYTPGQYVDLHILSNINDFRGHMRTFTLTSLPSDPFISFAAKFSGPLSGYKQYLQAMEAGTGLRVDDAMGDVVLPKSPSVPLVFVAGGLGIASFVSILRQLGRSGEKRRIQLFYARRTAADSPFADLLAQFPFSAVNHFVSPDRLKVSALLAAISPESLVYLSGSEQFVESLRQDLERGGVNHEQIVFDFFDGYNNL